MKTYTFKVTETITKTIEVEADTFAQAEIKALEAGLDYGNDPATRVAELLKVTDGSKYPLEANGWNLESPDNLSYWKQVDLDFYKAICLYWLDTTRGDEGWNPERDAWCVIEAEGDTAGEALEALDIMPWTISDVGRRVEVEKMLLDYIEGK